MPPAPQSATAEWKAHWPLVITAMLGLSFGTVMSLSLGLFMGPLEQEFGWSRAQISIGMTISALVSTPLSPFGGALVDRFGPRRVALPGVALTALAVAAFALLLGSYWQWIVWWVLYALCALLIRQTLWNSAVSSAFEKSRGMALAVMLCGLGIGQGLTPIIAHELIANHGWRTAYAVLGLGWGGMVLALLVPFFHTAVPQAAAGAPADNASPAARPSQLPGLTLRQALRNRQVLLIGLAMLLQAAVGGAFVIHMVPILIWSGIGSGNAAAMAGLVGLASIFGKLISGWLADRTRSGWLPFSAYGGPALAYLLIWQSHGSLAMITVAVLISGYSNGALSQLTAYLLSRYAGLAHYGKIFGLIASMMSLGAGIGPALAGIVYDDTHSYELLLLAGMPLALIAGLSVAFLGPYPDFTKPGAKA